MKQRIPPKNQNELRATCNKDLQKRELHRKAGRKKQKNVENNPFMLGRHHTSEIDNQDEDVVSWVRRIYA